MKGSLWSKGKGRDDAVSTILVLAAIFLLAVTGAVLVWAQGSKRDEIMLEVAKGCIQVSGVAIVGGIVAFILNRYQRLQLEEENERYRNQDDLRHRNERGADERRRQDEFLREILHDALAAYHAVKRVRRLQKIEFGKEQTDSSLTRIYELILELNDEQLKFERLKVVAKLVNDKRVPRVFSFEGDCYGTEDKMALMEMFEKIEKFLNRVFDEYRPIQRVDDAAKFITPAESAKVSEFLSSQGFRDISRPKDAIVCMLQIALLTPLVPMTLEDLCAERTAISRPTATPEPT